ncbi:hypothetical protein QL285_056100 [Trifolium repens]|nr:hypothetical protein QL285_056100 [Trifolium repens]
MCSPLNFIIPKLACALHWKHFSKENNFVCKSIFGIKEIRANGLIEGELTQNAPNLGQITSGSCQSGASPYIEGHTLQRFKVKDSLTWGTSVVRVPPV